MDKDLIVNMDIASLYPKSVFDYQIPRTHYETMYKLERIKKAMKEGTKVTPIRPIKRELFGEIGTVVSMELEHGCTGNVPTATIEVVFDKFPSQTFTFRPDNLALINVPTLEEFIMKNTVPGIKKVIYSGMKTVILWDDKTKTIVSCREGDIFDPYMGFCAAVMKKLFGSTSKIKKTIKEKASGRDDIDIFLD